MINDMEVEINKQGQIIISAETPLESFALSEIVNRWQKPQDVENSILIKTGIDN